MQEAGWLEDLSDVTRGRLRVYLDLLNRWNPSINLVSPGSLSDALSRHMADSAQLVDFCVPGRHLWADLGSGGGFPGLVVAILAKEQFPETRFVLVEADARKAAFLSTVSRETNVPVEVRNARIEDMKPMGADILSARALAPLTRLLGLAFRHLGAEGKCLFLKGSRYEAEIEEAKKEWSFNLTVHPSRIAAGSALLEIKDLKRA